MKKIITILLLLITPLAFANTLHNPKKFSQFLNSLIPYAKQHGVSQYTISHYLLPAKYQAEVIEKDRNQPEIDFSFEHYMQLFVSKNRVNQGKLFFAKHRKVLEEISQQYHIQPEYLVAILGVETNYGNNMGTFPVIASIATLSYQDNRHVFFKRELIAALKIAQNNEGLLSKPMIGSWAGAIGQCQFMPDLYLNYAVAYHHSGPADIWHNPADALASTANFFHQQGWNGKENAAVRIKLPTNFPLSEIRASNKKTVKQWQQLGITTYDGKPLPNWQGKTEIIFPKENPDRAYLINHNFRVLMRWNAAYLYALAVQKLALTIANEDKLVTTLTTNKHIKLRKAIIHKKIKQPNHLTLLRSELINNWHKYLNFSIYKSFFNLRAKEYNRKFYNSPM